MQELVDVRARMKSVAGIGEVCRTLSTVAAAKLAQTRDRALHAREYATVLRGMAERQQREAREAGVELASLSPLMESREVRSVRLLVIGADRGLCGGYNIALGRAARSLADSLSGRGLEVDATVIGRRVETYLRRATDVPIRSAQQWTRAGVTPALVGELLKTSTDDFLEGRVDEVIAVYTTFLSSISREPRVMRLLPVAPPAVTAEGPAVAPLGYFFEPSREACVAELLEALVRLQFEDVLLEAFASEQAARMVTMQEASERADRALADLRVRYNRLRREAITADLTGVLVAGRVRGVSHNAG